MQEKIPATAVMISSLLNYPRVLWGKFFSVLKPFEKQILTEALRRLSDKEKDILIDQIKEINCVQYVKGRNSSELNFYKLSLFKPIAYRNLKFESKDSIFKLLSLRFFLSKENNYKNAKLYVINGNFFSIECDFLIGSYREKEDISFID